nr:Protein spire [Ipomoea batatas]
MYHSPDIIIRKHGGRFRSTRENNRGLNWALELGVEVNEVVTDEWNCTDSGLDGVGMQGQAFWKEPRAGLGEEESASGSVVLLEAVIDYGVVRCKSVTDDDLDELRGCIDLGFGFHPEPHDLDPKLAHTFPALELFCAVNKHYNQSLSSMFDLGEDPETVKTKLKQWAQVVACSVRQSSRIP